MRADTHGTSRHDRPAVLVGMVAAALAILLALPGCSRHPRTSIESLSWLTGCWEGKAEGGIVDARWGKPAGGTLLGTNRLVKDEQTVYAEFSQLSQTGDGILLTLRRDGQPPATFTLERQGKTDATFANRRPTFPQKLLYHRQGGGTLIVRAEGEEDGRKERWRVKLKRVACD